MRASSTVIGRRSPRRPLTHGSRSPTERSLHGARGRLEGQGCLGEGEVTDAPAGSSLPHSSTSTAMARAVRVPRTGRRDRRDP